MISQRETMQNPISITYVLLFLASAFLAAAMDPSTAPSSDATTQPGDDHRLFQLDNTRPTTTTSLLGIVPVHSSLRPTAHTTQRKTSSSSTAPPPHIPSPSSSTRSTLRTSTSATSSGGISESITITITSSNATHSGPSSTSLSLPLSTLLPTPPTTPANISSLTPTTLTPTQPRTATLPPHFASQLPNNWPYTAYGIAKRKGQTATWTLTAPHLPLPPLAHLSTSPSSPGSELASNNDKNNKNDDDDGSAGVPVAVLVAPLLWFPRPVGVHKTNDDDDDDAFARDYATYAYSVAGPVDADVAALLIGGGGGHDAAADGHDVQGMLVMPSHRTASESYSSLVTPTLGATSPSSSSSSSLRSEGIVVVASYTTDAVYSSPSPSSTSTSSEKALFTTVVVTTTKVITRPGL